MNTRILKKYVWMLFALLVPTGFVSCSDSDKEEIVTPPENNEPDEPAKPTFTAENEMNEDIDEFLKSHYLWNKDYKVLTRDLTIPYVDSYENFLRTTLMQMTTNKLDKKENARGDYTLYSYVDRKEKKSKSRSAVASGVNHKVEKEDSISSYGFSRLASVSFVGSDGNPTGEYALVVQSVYPSSAAASSGIKRGSLIMEIDGEKLTESNYMSTYLELLHPTKSTVTLNVLNEGEKFPEDILLMTTKIDPTPIILSKVIEKGSHRIGYLVFEAFDAAYDNDLLDVLSDLKAQGITDMVLDLRYNGGGHVITAQMLAACMVGNFCRNKVFQYYRYNDDRMKTIETTERNTGNKYDATAKYFYDKFMFDNYYGVNLGNHALQLPRLYALVTNSSASASEVLISSLRGIGMEVNIIGENTNGKNVGMEVKEFDKGDYNYELAPITFQYYNAQKVTVPAEGLKPDYPVSDWNNGYVDFGEEQEPLLAKAIELITGTSTATAKARSEATIRMNRVPIDLPRVKGHHPQGAIVFR